MRFQELPGNAVPFSTKERSGSTVSLAFRECGGVKILSTNETFGNCHCTLSIGRRVPLGKSSSQASRFRNCYQIQVVQDCNRRRTESELRRNTQQARAFVRRSLEDLASHGFVSLGTSLVLAAGKPARFRGQKCVLIL